jgi:hypothetical protein
MAEEHLIQDLVTRLANEVGWRTKNWELANLNVF